MCDITGLNATPIILFHRRNRICRGDSITDASCYLHLIEWGEVIVVVGSSTELQPTTPTTLPSVVPTAREDARRCGEEECVVMATNNLVVAQVPQNSLRVDQSTNQSINRTSSHYTSTSLYCASFLGFLFLR